MDNRMLDAEILKLQTQLANAKVGSEDYDKLLATLKKLQELEVTDRKADVEDQRIEFEIMKVNNDQLKLLNDAKKIRSDERRDYIKLGVGTFAGFGAIWLTLVGEGEKIIRTKAWQTATGMLRKFM